MPNTTLPKWVYDVTALDIEATGLDANKGRLLSIALKKRGEKTIQVLSQKDVQEACRCCGRYEADDDSKLARAIREVLDEPSIIVTWFGKGYDKKYLNTRFAAAGAKPFPPTGHVDLYFVATTRYKLSSNSLGAAAEFFGIKTKKTHLAWDTWIKAGAGRVEAIDEVIKHNVADVIITGKLYEKMKGEVYQHPRLGDQANCASCGLPMTIDKYIPTHYKTSRIQLYCKRCRRYETRAVK